MNLETLIDSWIGNEQMHTIPSEYAIDGKPHETEYDRGHNAKTQDLKSRKQELIEGIASFLEKEITYLSYEHENLTRHGDMPQDAYDRVLDFIVGLTGKFDHK